MSDKVTYTIIVDRAMFPFAPGSEVVYQNDLCQWREGLFIMYIPNITHHWHVYSKKAKRIIIVDNCYHISTHAHLLGTTYPADTPSCAKCGKAAPEPYRLGVGFVCLDCHMLYWEKGHQDDKPTATTKDGLTVKIGEAVFHPVFGRGHVTVFNSSMAAEFQRGNRSKFIELSDCYSLPCARLADGSVAMVGKVWHPTWGEMEVTMKNDDISYATNGGNIGANLNECYQIGSRIITPKELEEGQNILDDIVEERDALRVELDALKATTATAQTVKFQKFQRVLVRDHENEVWCIEVFERYVSGDHYPYFCLKMAHKYCVAYDGNEHLLGTIDSPK